MQRHDRQDAAQDARAVLRRHVRRMLRGPGYPPDETGAGGAHGAWNRRKSSSRLGCGLTRRPASPPLIGLSAAAGFVADRCLTWFTAILDTTRGGPRTALALRGEGSRLSSRRRVTSMRWSHHRRPDPIAQGRSTSVPGRPPRAEPWKDSPPARCQMDRSDGPAG